MSEAPERIEIGPQPGPQTKFLGCDADIAIYGGAAGGGKSFAILLDAARHFATKKMSAVIFRRETPQITNPGGLWDEAYSLYTLMGARPNIGNLYFKFPGGMKVKFSHLEQERNVFDWQGSQIGLIGFDELSHFTEKQFFYMLSRNRSTSGIKPYIRGSTNPDPTSWVRRLLDWWIGPDGFPIPERDGVIRWFYRKNNEIIWADKKHHEHAKSITFIAAKLSDNKILEAKDPGYRANLEAMPYVERMQLLGGNWNIKPAAGNFFKRKWFEVVDALPANLSASIRCWDKAASEKPEADYTVGLKMHRSSEGMFYISDVVRFQGSPGKVKQTVLNTASQDGKGVAIGLKQDPGQAGIYEVQDYVRALAGYMVKIERESKDKQTRAKPLSAQCEIGNVKLLRGDWNEAFLNELESFPDLKLDDQVDSASGAFNLLTSGPGEFGKGHAKKASSKHVRNEDYD